MNNGNDPYASIGARIVGGGAIRGSQYDTAQAKAQADLEKQRIEIAKQAEELHRLQGTPMPQAPKPLAEREAETRRINRAQLIGTEAAKVEKDIPRIEYVATDARRKLRELMGHPGFSAAVGAPNPFKGGLGFGTIPFTPARDFSNRLVQLRGGAFLQAIQALRGTGPVANIEGEKATAALNRMETATSEAEFRAAAADFDQALANGVQVSRQTARMGGLPYSYDQLKAEQERRAARGK